MSSDPQKLIGQIFEGRYEILGRIGAGGMGTVYKARHLAMERDVAIKVLNRYLVNDEPARKRFVREMKATSSIDSPNTVSVFDYGTTEEGDAYLVMEFLEGLTLKQVLRADGALALDRLVSIARQVASALGTAHDKGIIHRDIKPENIIVVKAFDGSERVKVLDFGIAQIGIDTSQTSPDQLTATGTVLGTPSYMSPERGRGHDFDHRADLYSLGVLMFVMATGKPPYESTEPMGVLFKHITDPIPALSEKNDIAYPPWLEAVIRALMAKKEDDRPDTAADFLKLLDGAMSGEPVVVAAPQEAAPKEAAPTTTDNDAPTQLLSPADPPPAQSSHTEVLPSRSDTAKLEPPPKATSSQYEPGLSSAMVLALMALMAFFLLTSTPEEPDATPGAAVTSPSGAAAPAEEASKAAPSPEAAAPKRVVKAPPGQITRRLAAILFTDMVGFTRLMGHDEAASLALLRVHNATLTAAFKAHGGRIIKEMGDGYMVEFSSSVEATNAALTAQKKLAKRNAGKPEDKQLRVRMGINTGDVIVQGNDLLGEVVNVASQLRRLAAPGTIAVTQEVQGDLRGKVQATGQALPPTTLKGHKGDVTVLLLSPADATLSTVKPAAPVANQPARAGAASKVVAPEVTRLLKEAKALLKKKAPAQALQLANKALDTLPGHGPAMLLSAEARTRLKQFGLAVTVLKSCSEVQPSFAPCLYELGRAYERMGNRGAATKAFNDVVTRFPGSTSAIEATRRLGK